MADEDTDHEAIEQNPIPSQAPAAPEEVKSESVPPEESKEISAVNESNYNGE